jgi:hypothetical protein
MFDEVQAKLVERARLEGAGRIMHSPRAVSDLAQRRTPNVNRYSRGTQIPSSVLKRS